MQCHQRCSDALRRLLSKHEVRRLGRWKFYPAATCEGMTMGIQGGSDAVSKEASGLSRPIKTLTKKSLRPGDLRGHRTWNGIIVSVCLDCLVYVSHERASWRNQCSLQLSLLLVLALCHVVEGWPLSSCWLAVSHGEWRLRSHLPRAGRARAMSRLRLDAPSRSIPLRELLWFAIQGVCWYWRTIKEVHYNQVIRDENVKAVDTQRYLLMLVP